MSSQVLAQDKIVQANNLINYLEPLYVCNVMGVSKLEKKIQAEIKFLKKGLKAGNLKDEHIHCSNVGQLAAIVDVATSIPGVAAVLKSFDNGCGDKLTVDVVGNNNAKWYKVILRNPKALHQLYMIGGRNGVRPLDKVAEEFLHAACVNPNFFVPPKVCFYFVKGVSEELAKCLMSCGIEIKGEIINTKELNMPDYSVCDDEDNMDDYSGNDSPDDASSSSDSDLQDCESKDSGNSVSYDPLDHCNQEQISCLAQQDVGSRKHFKKVNLDVTCLIAYVSSTSNGGCNFIFQDQFLAEQATSERKYPVKQILESYFEDCELLVCTEAVTHFRSILQTIGGQQEIERGEMLLERCTIVPSQDLFKCTLKTGGRIKELSRKVFGTGHAHKAPTVSSNRGFVRASENQGLKLAVLSHEPRALTEKKEGLAKPFVG